MAKSSRVHGSFRDPSGQVLEEDGRIFRIVSEYGRDDYETVRDSGLLQRLSAAGRVVGAAEVERPDLATDGVAYVLEHPKLGFISHPYEWPFALLKAAALLHLDLQIEAFDARIALVDASAYNIQFRGPEPIFIDYLSFRPYRDGEFWGGHRQFCEQFLNPLLLRAYLGVAHNEWYRGTLEGIATADLARLLPFWRKLLPKALIHVVLQARLQKSADSHRGEDVAREIRRGQLPAPAYRRMLVGLHKWIEGLQPADGGATQWRDYAASHSYSDDEQQRKQRFVERFSSQLSPQMIWDLGCNTGDYSAAALRHGAGCAIGFDYDQGALDLAVARAREEELDLLPLYFNASNPSPDQGWAELERAALMARAGADAVIALAFIHHVVIAGNVPMGDFLDWLVALAPAGVLEFVPKQDPMVARLLGLREDIFWDYTVENFNAALSKRVQIVASETISASGRMLVWWQR